jgi:hypothetical protein
MNTYNKGYFEGEWQQTGTPQALVATSHPDVFSFRKERRGERQKVADHIFCCCTDKISSYRKMIQKGRMPHLGVRSALGSGCPFLFRCLCCSLPIANCRHVLWISGMCGRYGRAYAYACLVEIERRHSREGGRGD